jgi:hypothetical protein
VANEHHLELAKHGTGPAELELLEWQVQLDAFRKNLKRIAEEMEYE